MKLKKFAALVLSLVLTAGAAGCSAGVSETAPEKTAEPTLASTDSSEETVAAEPSLRESGTGSYAEKPAAEVSDTEGGKLVIWGYDPGFKKLLEKYSPVKDYEYVELSADDYEKRLDEAFAAGKAPDLFLCGYDSVKRYAESDKTIPINDIGIAYKSCSDMYDYTLRLASDNAGNIKGLAWALAPSAVFYQKSLAAQYLGSSVPAQVAKSFSSWDSFLTAARKVSKDSDGSVKIVSGTDDLYKSYMSARASAWETDGKLEIDGTADAYLSFVKTLGNEKLTHGAVRNSDAWKTGMKNKTVLSYWGPLSLARSSDFALDPLSVRKANPTSGDWGMVAAPGAFAWGGTWIMVSSSCDMKKSCADILGAVCLDQGNLKDMLSSGKCDFVNSRKVITAAAADERYVYNWLGGQNPYEILAPEAERIEVSFAGSDDERIDGIFSRIADTYVEGGIKTVRDAKSTFRQLLIEKKIVKG